MSGRPHSNDILVLFSNSSNKDAFSVQKSQVRDQQCAPCHLTRHTVLPALTLSLVTSFTTLFVKISGNPSSTTMRYTFNCEQLAGLYTAKYFAFVAETGEFSDPIFSLRAKLPIVLDSGESKSHLAVLKQLPAFAFAREHLLFIRPCPFWCSVRLRDSRGTTCSLLQECHRIFSPPSTFSLLLSYPIFKLLAM